MRPLSHTIAEGLAVLVLAGTAACSPSLDWRQFTWPDGGFGALLPATPTQEIREVSVGSARLKLHLFSAAAAGNAYGAGYADVPAGMDPGSRERLLDDARSGFARNVGASPASAERNAIEGFPCQQFVLAGTASGRAVQLAARVCVTDSRYYQLIFIGPAENARNADVPLFLGSLKLL